MRLLAVAASLFLAPGFAAEVELPAAAAYDRALTALVDMGAIPTFRDKELLLIKTDPFPQKLTTEEADCGSMFGIPYLKDKRTKVAAIYQVRVKAIDEQRSDVSITVGLDGYMDVNEGAPFFVDKTRDNSKVLTCTSKGALEAQLLEAISVTAK